MLRSGKNNIIELGGHLRYGDLNDFVRCAKLYAVSYEEYMEQFELYNKTKDERQEFMSQVSLRLLYNIYLTPDLENVFWNKVEFLKRFQALIKREWFEPNKLSFEDFYEKLNEKRWIAKPLESSCGAGVFMIEKKPIKDDAVKLYNELQENYVCEECIRNENSLREFHASSLNTVRIVTVKNRFTGRTEILGSFVRFGTGGNIVDNGGRDGILAMIDCETGKIMTHAYDKKGRCYKVHPDSGLSFMGFQIPKFHEMIEVCKRASDIEPMVKIIGWDVVVNNAGLVDIIEGNHRPDAYGLQTPVKKGYKTRLYNLLNSRQ